MTGFARLMAAASLAGALAGCSALDDFSDAMNAPLTPQQQYEMDQYRTRQANQQAINNALINGSMSAGAASSGSTPYSGGPQRPRTESGSSEPRPRDPDCGPYKKWNRDLQECRYIN